MNTYLVVRKTVGELVTKTLVLAHNETGAAVAEELQENVVEYRQTFEPTHKLQPVVSINNNPTTRQQSLFYLTDEELDQLEQLLEATHTLHLNSRTACTRLIEKGLVCRAHDINLCTEAGIRALVARDIITHGP